MSKKMLAIFLLCSFVGNIFMLYHILDMGVTNTYLEDDLHRREGQTETIKKIFPILLKNISRKSFITEVSKTKLEFFEKEGINAFYFGDVKFSFDGDKIIAVSFDEDL